MQAVCINMLEISQAKCEFQALTKLLDTYGL